MPEAGIVLKGRLTKLRPVISSDIPIMRGWFADPETMVYWGVPRPFVTERQLEADLTGRFASFDTEGYFTILDPTDIPIGRIDFEITDRRVSTAEIGILIGEATARGKGYGSDAVRTLLHFLFADRHLHRVALTVLAWNVRAIHAYERVGFQPEGVLRDHRFADGGYVDEIQMSILRREFDALDRPRDPS